MCLGDLHRNLIVGEHQDQPCLLALPACCAVQVGYIPTLHGERLCCVLDFDYCLVAGPVELDPASAAVRMWPGTVSL